MERKIIDGFFEPQSCQIIMKIGGVNAFHSAKGSTYSFGFFMAVFGHLKLNPFGLGEASFSKVTTFTPKKCQKWVEPK